MWQTKAKGNKGNGGEDEVSHWRKARNGRLEKDDKAVMSAPGTNNGVHTPRKLKDQKQDEKMKLTKSKYVAPSPTREPISRSFDSATT